MRVLNASLLDLLSQDRSPSAPGRQLGVNLLTLLGQVLHGYVVAVITQSN